MGWGSEGDINEVGLSDLTGFGFTNVSILPHFKSELKQEIDIYKNMAQNPVIELADGEALFVENSEYKVIK